MLLTNEVTPYFPSEFFLTRCKKILNCQRFVRVSVFQLDSLWPVDVQGSSRVNWMVYSWQCWLLNLMNFELLFNVLFITSDVYVTVSEVLKFETHYGVQKFAFTFSRPTFNTFTNKRLRKREQLEALGQCIPPPRHVLPVLRYQSRCLL